MDMVSLLMAIVGKPLAVKESLHSVMKLHLKNLYRFR